MGAYHRPRDGEPKPGDEQQDPKGEPKPGQRMSQQDAQRMLDALNQEERNVQERLRDKRGRAVQAEIEKDW